MRAKKVVYYCTYLQLQLKGLQGGTLCGPVFYNFLIGFGQLIKNIGQIILIFFRKLFEAIAIACLLLHMFRRLGDLLTIKI